jgi:hypothetical protein
LTQTIGTDGNGNLFVLIVCEHGDCKSSYLTAGPDYIKLRQEIAAQGFKRIANHWACALHAVKGKSNDDETQG